MVSDLSVEREVGDGGSICYLLHPRVRLDGAHDANRSLFEEVGPEGRGVCGVSIFLSVVQALLRSLYDPLCLLLLLLLHPVFLVLSTWEISI